MRCACSRLESPTCRDEPTPLPSSALIVRPSSREQGSCVQRANRLSGAIGLFAGRAQSRHRLNTIKDGRTAAWFISRTVPGSGKVALFVGCSTSPVAGCRRDPRGTATT